MKNKYIIAVGVLLLINKNSIGQVSYPLPAGQNNTGTAGKPASGSAFFGTDAGIANTGSDNTFLGFQTGFLNLNGGSNSFIGTNAGISNTTGSSNSFIGKDAGIYNTTGNYNSYIGTKAGYANNGNQNTFTIPNVLKLSSGNI